MGVNLKILVVERCDNMKRSPMLSKNKSIERLSLKDCRSLVEIDASIESLQKLVFLDLSGCWSLKELPEQLCSLKKLKTLWAENTSIEFLPKSFTRKWSKLESFKTTLFHPGPYDPISIHRYAAGLPQQEFSITCQSTLGKLWQSFGSLVLSKMELRCHNLSKLPKSIGELNKLKELSIRDCPLIMKLPNSIGNLKSLIMLDIIGTAISKLPNSIGNLRNLKSMYISCKFLEGLPSGIWNLEKLEVFHMQECKKLELSIPDDIGKLINLRLMYLDCKRIHSISGSISSLCSLHDLHLIGATNLLESLPDLPTSLQSLTASSMSIVVSKLTNLETLRYEYDSDTRRVDVNTLPPGLLDFSIYDCKNIESLPPISSSTLEELDVWRCYSLESLGDLSDLTNLSVLMVQHCDRIREIQGLSRLASLRVLSVNGCSGLVTIDGLEHLDLLESLDISGCKSIEYLPDISHLKNLRQIDAEDSRFEHLTRF